MTPLFNQQDKISLQELDDYLKIKIGMIDGMDGDLSGIYPGSTKVENVGGGKIKINDREYVVYSHPTLHPVSMITGLSTVATSGKYSDLSGVPTKLPASDVYDWAKQPTKPTYSPEEVNAVPASKLGVPSGVPVLNEHTKLPIEYLPDNLSDLAQSGSININQIPRLDITEKLKDNPLKTFILGGLTSFNLGNITVEEIDALPEI